MMRHLFAVVAAIAALATGASAQGKFQARLLGFTPDLRFDLAFAHDPAGEDLAAPVEAPIKGYLNHEFEILELRSRKVVFTTGKDRESMNREGELIGEVTLPANMSSGLLVFLPSNPGAKAKSRVMVIDDSKSAFPVGSFHITNLSGFPVRLMLEKEPFDFTPGKAILIKEPPMRTGMVSGMRAFVNQDGQKWAALSTGLWPHPGTGRCLKFFFQDPATGKVQLRAFDDVPPRERIELTAGTENR